MMKQEDPVEEESEPIVKKNKSLPA
jgi:hypothetical protein